MDAHNDIGLLDRNKLLEIFDYLNQQLKENAMQLELTIYGGCIMTMVFDNRPATKDIDCVFSQANDKLRGERQINFIKYLGEDLGYDWQ